MALTVPSQTVENSIELYIPPSSQPYIELAPSGPLGPFTQLNIRGKTSAVTQSAELWVLERGRKAKQPLPTDADCKVRLKVMAMPVRTIKVGIYRALGLPAGVPDDATIIGRLKESYRQACIDVVQTGSGTLSQNDWDANGDGSYSYNTSDRTNLTNWSKTHAKMNLVILPKASVNGGGMTVSENCAAIFAESFADLNELPFTCAHEAGHLLGISTRNLPPRLLADGSLDKGEQHDAGNDNANLTPDDTEVFPSYQWTDTTQLLLRDRVANPGWYSGSRSDENQDPDHGYQAAWDNSHSEHPLSVMHPGGGQRTWLRHEDWRAANLRALFFQ